MLDKPIRKTDVANANKITFDLLVIHTCACQTEESLRLMHVEQFGVVAKVQLLMKGLHEGRARYRGLQIR